MDGKVAILRNADRGNSICRSVGRGLLINIGIYSSEYVAKNDLAAAKYSTGAHTIVQADDGTYVVFASPTNDPGALDALSEQYGFAVVKQTP